MKAHQGRARRYAAHRRALALDATLEERAVMDRCSRSAPELAVTKHPSQPTLSPTFLDILLFSTYNPHTMRGVELCEGSIGEAGKVDCIAGMVNVRPVEHIQNLPTHGAYLATYVQFAGHGKTRAKVCGAWSNSTET